MIEVNLLHYHLRDSVLNSGHLVLSLLVVVEPGVLGDLVSHVVDLPVHNVHAQVHGLGLEVGHEGPGVEPALVLVSVAPHGDALGRHPGKAVIQLRGAQKLNAGAEISGEKPAFINSFKT